MTLLELQKALKEGKEVTNNGGETYLKIENKYYEVVNNHVLNGEFVERNGKTDKLVERRGSIVLDIDCFLKNDTGYKLYKKPILDEVEKKYLSKIICPFREKYKIMIQKNHSISYPCEYIYIYLQNDKLTYNNSFDLPFFKEGEMYKGMELNKKYSLEELGL